jgi:hypothetical protein
MFAESLPLGVPYLVRGLNDNNQPKSGYERSLMEKALFRASVELGRLPAELLHTKLQEGPYGTPAKSIAAIAAPLGYEVDAATLDQTKIAEMGARVWGDAFVKYAQWRVEQFAKGNGSVTDSVELLVFAFDALAAIPAEDRAKPTQSGTSIAEAMKSLAGVLGIPAAADLTDAKAWRELEGRAYAALFTHEADMLRFMVKLPSLNKNYDASREKSEAAGWADRIAHLDEAVLSEVHGGMKTSPLDELRATADALKIEHDGTTKDLIAKLRAWPAHKSPRGELEDPLQLGSDLYIWILPQKGN